MPVNAIDPDKLHSTMDAAVWAATFMETQRKHGPLDEASMLGWFANAIMCGWDHHAQRYGEGEPSTREQAAAQWEARQTRAWGEGER